jgi:hypothetical protein
MTAQARRNACPQVDQNMKNALRASHWGFGAKHPDAVNTPKTPAEA